MKNLVCTLLAFLGFPGCGSAARNLNQELRIVPEPSAGGVEVAWLGTAGLYVTDKETALLVDPFVSKHDAFRVGFGHPLPVAREAIRGLLRDLGAPVPAAVLVGHSHYDHSMDAPFFAMETGAVLVGSESTANVARGAGLPEDQIRVVQNAESMEFGKFRVTFFETVHGLALFGKVPYPGEIREPVVPPAPASAYRVGLVFGIHIAHPAGILLQTGSAGFLPGQWDAVRADVALLCIAGRSDTASLVRNVAIAVQAREVIPIHFDDLFGEIREPPDFLFGVDFAEFVRTVRERWPTLGLRTLPVGKRVRVLPLR